MQALPVPDDVQAHEEPVARYNAHVILCAGENSAIGVIAEHGIVDHHGGERPKRAYVTDIFLGAIVPGAARHRLADPATSPSLGHKTAAGCPVIRLGRVPEAVTTLFRARIDEAPGAQSRGIAKAKIVGRVF